MISKSHELGQILDLATVCLDKRPPTLSSCNWDCKYSTGRFFTRKVMVKILNGLNQTTRTTPGSAQPASANEKHDTIFIGHTWIYSLIFNDYLLISVDYQVNKCLISFNKILVQQLADQCEVSS